MSAKARGLGRGLDALLPRVEKGVQDVALAQLRTSPLQPRRTFDEAAIAELAGSVAEKGVLQPIVVRPVDGGFEVVAGGADAAIAAMDVRFPLVASDGATVHLDDIRKQVERMLLNVQELLRAQNSSFTDLVQVITYLKRSSYLSTFTDVWQQWGLGSLPNSIVEAGVCRPDLLCELEAIAIIPHNGN